MAAIFYFWSLYQHWGTHYSNHQSAKKYCVLILQCIWNVKHCLPHQFQEQLPPCFTDGFGYTIKGTGGIAHLDNQFNTTFLCLFMSMLKFLWIIGKSDNGRSKPHQYTFMYFMAAIIQGRGGRECQVWQWYHGIHVSYSTNAFWWLHCNDLYIPLWYAQSTNCEV